MPDWMIKIDRKTARKRKGIRISRIEFTPNPREVLAGDVINWRNNDIEDHWPAPIENGQLVENGYMDNAIPPGTTSDKAFSPGPVLQDTELEYGCMLHPGEKGVIKVLRYPPTPKGEAP
jgi:plastocyanin